MGGSAGGSATVIIPSSFALRGFVAILGLPGICREVCQGIRFLSARWPPQAGPHVGPGICHGICRLYIYVMSSHKYILFWDHVSARRSASYIYIAFRPLNFILGICHKVCRLYIYMVSYTPIIPKSTYSGICHEICQLYIYVTFGP